MAPSDPVSIVRFHDDVDSVRKAIELCDGFDDLRRDDKVLIKPNVCVGRNRTLPPFGVVTTSRLVERLIQVLFEKGIHDISIAEGSIVTPLSNTRTAFAYAGMDRLSGEYGVKLLDLNRGPFRSLSIGGFDFEISSAVFDADFVINVAVLKNHFQTRVSLCMKNLKGCLSQKTRKDCHRWDLETSIALYNTVIPVHLNLIDGIYALVGGPWIDSGTPVRSNLILAGKDRLNCDRVGSSVLGVDPMEVGHIREFARMESREDLFSGVPIRGEKLEMVRVTANRYEPKDLFEGVFQRAGIQGILFPDPGTSLCSGCFGNLMVALLLFCQDNPGRALDPVEVIAGEGKGQHGGEKTRFLYGDCAIHRTPDRPERGKTVVLKGCPPLFFRTYATLLKALLPQDEADRQLSDMISLKTREKTFTLFDHLEAPVFDMGHF